MRMILNWTGEWGGVVAYKEYFRVTVDNLWINVDNFPDRQKLQSKRQKLPSVWQKLPVLGRI